MDSVQLGANEILYSFLLVNNTDKKRYWDLQTDLMINAYTQNWTSYPQSTIDTKRMINNYVSKFIARDNSKKKSKSSQLQENNEEQQAEEEEILFLWHQDEN